MPKLQTLAPELSSLIATLRSQIRRYVVWDTVLAVLLVVFLAFWIGLALDYLPVKLGGTEMPRSARAVLILVALAGTLTVVYRLLLCRLWRSLPDDSLALLVERQYPKLGGRLVTAVQLSHQGRQGDSHDQAFFDRVHTEAAQAVKEVDTNRIFQWAPLIRKSAVVFPLVIAAIGFAIISPQTFAHAASRLTLLSDSPWPRRAKLEMVGIELPQITASETQTEQTVLLEFDNKVIRLPRGSNGVLRIRAKASDGAIVPTVCTAYYQTEEGDRGQANLRRVGREVDGYQSFLLDGPPLTGLSESMTISIHGLDDRLVDFQIQAIDPPTITQFDIGTRYPNYLREGRDPNDVADDSLNSYQAGLRVREGSRVTLSAKSSVPLGAVDVVIEQNNIPIEDVNPLISDDGQMVQIQLDHFDAATTIRMVPIDQDGISAQAPYRYFLSVIRDEAPVATIRLPGIGSAVTPIARIPVFMTATDDYGISQATLNAAPSQGKSTEPNANQIPLKSAVLHPVLDREGETQTAIDLRDLVTTGEILAPEPGSLLNVFAEASDQFDLDGTHLSRSEIIQLQVVTPDRLLALLERRELELRSRLEQTIDETRTLRDSLARLKVTGFPTNNPDSSETPGNENLTSDPSRTRSDAAEQRSDGRNQRPINESREVQIIRLRIQQSHLQASKTSDELSGIVASLGDLLDEMVNNRVDSVDRRNRIGDGVRQPLQNVIDQELKLLLQQIDELSEAVASQTDPDQIANSVVQTADEVLLKLSVVLEKMIDLESYNEILDLVRQLIGDQDELLEATKEEQTDRIKSLFD